VAASPAVADVSGHGIAESTPPDSQRIRYIPPLHPGAGNLRPPATLSKESAVTKDEIEPQVIVVVAEKLSADKDKINRNTNFTSDLNADSLDLVELVMELEERFDIQIPDDQTSKILTVGNAVDFIHDQMQAKGTK
jgi:acyl carrier protein